MAGAAGGDPPRGSPQPVSGRVINNGNKAYTRKIVPEFGQSLRWRAVGFNSKCCREAARVPDEMLLSTGGVAAAQSHEANFLSGKRVTFSHVEERVCEQRGLSRAGCSQHCQVRTSRGGLGVRQDGPNDITNAFQFSCTSRKTHVALLRGAAVVLRTGRGIAAHQFEGGHGDADDGMTARSSGLQRYCAVSTASKASSSLPV